MSYRTSEIFVICLILHYVKFPLIKMGNEILIGNILQAITGRLGVLFYHVFVNLLARKRKTSQCIYMLIVLVNSCIKVSIISKLARE